MEKMIVDGKVAVLYSPGFGAGWSTWNSSDAEGLCFDSRIIEHVIKEDYEKVEEITEQLYPGTYTGGARQLDVVWLPVGTQFEITEYDGSESVEILSEKRYLTA